MRAIRVVRHGRPTEVIEVQDIPVPDVEPGGVRVAVSAAAVNFGDIARCRGGIASVMAQPPFTLGMDVCGVVDAAGAGAEEWIGRRGGGATVNGEPLGAVRPKERIEILSFEATRTSLIAAQAPAVVELAYRLRIMGSLALSLCHLAAGRVDAVCSLKPARSVDIAAAQLLCREVGLAIELFDDPRRFEEAELDLEGRSRVAAAGTADVCRQVAAALSA